ncbi:MAG TPA: sigma-70 family RNA polymerase sigma factor [Bacteroidales bacterium]|nr:sigma-70 family RNA polymerase sigma factor [Bacteroidales bacterium]HRR48635.1 sigma-70 family RNA polymerase sigma factor [Bacteroidales bacterium]HRT33472.1 sigma-70 family RNA polymerase sigma factor [Bacteroidales bacterium]HRT83080.1 sigma-70 family RNA polymerase sigma factor [Bacteroidales bacterium]
MINHHILIGDKKYEFKEIFKDFFPSQVIFASKIVKDDHLAEDVVQEVFLKLWRSEAFFQNEISFKAYLYLSTRNRCIDFLRTKKIKTGNIELGLNVEEEANIVLKEEAFRLLDKAIANLAPQSQKIIKLSMQGFSIQEISEKLSISVNTVKTLKARAYKTLRNHLGEIFILMLSPFL